MIKFLVLIILSILACTSASNLIGRPDGHEIPSDFAPMLELVESLPMPPTDKYCNCSGYQCECCAHVSIHKLHINDEVCANLTYITSPPGFDVVVSIGHKVVLNKTVSLQDPDVCFDIPVPVLDAKACLDFTNISLTKTNVSACIAIDFSVLHKDLGTVSLGCFGINFDLGVESRFKVIKKLLDQQKELLAHKYDSILKQIPITDDEPSNKISNKMVDPNVSSGDFCECSGEQCDCCAHVSIHKLKINDSVCVNITLLESELALNILLIVDNKVVMNKTLSLSSLSKLCVPLPWVPDSKVCIDFNNINITKDEVSACVGFEAYLFHIRLFSIDLGCFHFHIGDQHRQLPIALMLKKLGEEIQRVKELN